MRRYENENLVTIDHPETVTYLDILLPQQNQVTIRGGDTVLSEGQPLRPGQPITSAHVTLTPIHAPGHSPDHICLFEPERGWLFSGDTYIGGQDRAQRAGQVKDASPTKRLPQHEGQYHADHVAQRGGKLQQTVDLAPHRRAEVIGDQAE